MQTAELKVLRGHKSTVHQQFLQDKLFSGYSLFLINPLSAVGDPRKVHTLSVRGTEFSSQGEYLEGN
jgi:hypothetical protein